MYLSRTPSASNKLSNVLKVNVIETLRFRWVITLKAGTNFMAFKRKGEVIVKSDLTIATKLAKIQIFKTGCKRITRQLKQLLQVLMQLIKRTAPLHKAVGAVF